jgi:hypothetical protein
VEKETRKFYYRTVAYKGEAFHLEVFKATSYSEAMEKAMEAGVMGDAPDEIHIRKQMGWTIA